MLKVDQVMNILELRTQGFSLRAISEKTGHSRNTVKKVLGEKQATSLGKKARGSKLDPYKEHLEQRFKEHGLSAVRLVEEIRALGYEGTVDAVRRHLRQFRRARTREERVTVRFETAPGKQAQADWGYCGKIDEGGRQVSLYVFVIVLSYSRQLFVHFTTSMKMAALVRCHQLAFDYFGGWPESILYDNMKQVRISRSKWNEQFLDFANHHGFTPKTHLPYRPRTKGKVERSVDYVKDSLLKGLEFSSLSELNARALHWLENTCNVRVHATTKERPVDRFEKESPFLTPVSTIGVYDLIAPVNRTVSWESTICFQGSRYSVPPAYAGEVVQVTAAGGMIHVRSGDSIVAEHQQAVRPGQSIMDRDHIAEVWKLVNEQTRLPDGRCFHPIQRPEVQRVPLSVFEEVLS